MRRVGEGVAQRIVGPARRADEAGGKQASIAVTIAAVPLANESRANARSVPKMRARSDS